MTTCRFPFTPEEVQQAYAFAQQLHDLVDAQGENPALWDVGGNPDFIAVARAQWALLSGSSAGDRPACDLLRQLCAVDKTGLDLCLQRGLPPW